MDRGFEGEGGGLGGTKAVCNSPSGIEPPGNQKSA